MHRGLTVLLAAATVLATAAMATGGPGPERTERFVVDASGLSPAALAEAAAEAGGHVVRVDERLDLAVVRLADPAAFEQATGAAPAPDARGALDTETGLAEAPDDPRLPEQWGPAELNAPQAWQLAPEGTTVTVGVVDSGIARWHGDLSGYHMTLGHDYVDDDGEPQDANGHGTHVAGIVTALRDNGEGIAGMASTELFVPRVFGADGTGYCTDFASGIQDAVEAGVDVINFSGHCDDHYRRLQTAIEDAVDAGIPVVVSAGNAQFTNPSKCVRHPAVHDAAIAVGATDPTGTPAIYSCQGAGLELAAPGTQVVSTVPPNGYAYYSGTSMAAPHVTATIAMLLEEDPERSVDEIRQTLRETARDLGPPGWDPAYGYGMVDPVAALTGDPVYTDPVEPG
jgi:subtilisin family serine protease